MSLWFWLNITAQTGGGHQRLGLCEIRRQQHLDLTDREAIADAVSTYTVRIDGVERATVRHRYGAGAWPLARAALDAAFPDRETHQLAELRQLIDHAHHGGATVIPIATLRQHSDWPTPPRRGPHRAGRGAAE